KRSGCGTVGKGGIPGSGRGMARWVRKSGDMALSIRRNDDDGGPLRGIEILAGDPLDVLDLDLRVAVQQFDELSGIAEHRHRVGELVGALLDVRQSFEMVATAAADGTVDFLPGHAAFDEPREHVVDLALQSVLADSRPRRGDDAEDARESRRVEEGVDDLRHLPLPEEGQRKPRACRVREQVAEDILRDPVWMTITGCGPRMMDSREGDFVGQSFGAGRRAKWGGLG